MRRAREASSTSRAVTAGASSMPPSYRYGRRTLWLWLDFDDERAGADRRGAEDRRLVVVRCELWDDDRDTVRDRLDDPEKDGLDTVRDRLQEVLRVLGSTVRELPERPGMIVGLCQLRRLEGET